jgi:hypothetical protein
MHADLGYWVFIIKQEPEFNLVVEVKDWFGFPISGVVLILEGEINRREDASKKV